MHLTEFHLRRFRNIRSLDWSPAAGINLIWGENGQGKTNMLEGLHLALTGRSFRTRRDEECLPWAETAHAVADDNEPTMAEVNLVRRPGERKLRLLLSRNWKRAFVDGQWLPRLADLWSEAAVVTFTPDEAGLFKGPPAARRRLGL